MCYLVEVNSCLRFLGCFQVAYLLYAAFGLVLEYVMEFLQASGSYLSLVGDVQTLCESEGENSCP